MKDSGEDERVFLARRRTYLANERTFLAWVRTGLACMGGGLAIMRFLTFNSPLHQTIAQGVGALLVLLGLGAFVLSYLDYRTSYKNLKIRPGHAGSLAVIFVIVAILALITLTLLYISLYSSTHGVPQ